MSALSLDEAIKNVHDESAVNQLVGSLEKSLELQTNSLKSFNAIRDVKRLSEELTPSGTESQNIGAGK